MVKISLCYVYNVRIQWIYPIDRSSIMQTLGFANLLEMKMTRRINVFSSRIELFEQC